jgi:hypothetical protein
MKWVGWKSRAMLDRYNVVDTEDLKDAAAKLNNYMQSMKKTPTWKVEPIKKAAK